jgi:hypothetical protein
MTRSWRWTTYEGKGVEHVAIAESADGIIADGVVIGPDTAALFGCSYTIRCDARWRVRQVEVRVAGGVHLVLRADGEGRWSGKNGDPLPLLDGCIDVDLTCTPFTNTLPIRRLNDALRVRQEITVAYITLPEASVMPSRQAYTKLDANRYLFESISNPFRAEIETDADGFVLHYPGLFDRTG